MRAPQKNWLEWAVFWGGLALVAGVSGYLVYAAATRGDRPPQLSVTAGLPEPAPGGFAVPVSVSNAGDVTAASVTIEVRAADGPESERGEITFAHVPHGSERHGWVMFEQRPDPGRLRARVLGYEKP